MLCFRLLMSQMEQVLDQHLEDDYKHLGLPYWDWSSDQSKIYQHEHNGEELIVPLFPDFWQEVKVGYKNPNHGSYKDAFEDKGAGWGDHCTSDRYLDTVSRSRVEPLVKDRLPRFDMTVANLDRSIQNAMRQTNLEDFGTELSYAHNPIHSGFGCRMYGIGKKHYSSSD